MSIATFSNELKIFNAESFLLTASVPVCDQVPTFGRISWSGDGQWMTVAPVKSCYPLPVYRFAKNELRNAKNVGISNVTSASFFNWTNKDLAIGTSTGDVYLWDLKERAIARNVSSGQKHSVDHICLNSDDACIATASLNSNKICVHSFKTNKVINTFTMPKSESTSSLRFCMCKKTYLAASSFERTICVWDIVKSEVVYKNYSSRSGACSDIAFSPINYSVFTSVSLTGSLKMFDLREKSLIISVKLDEPLHCIDMIGNGDKVAMGTPSGKVIFYDLRIIKNYHTLKAHCGPVLSVRTETKKPPESFKEINMDSPDVVETQSKTLDLSLIDILSPIGPNYGEKTSGSSKSVTFHSTPKIINSESQSTVECDSFFSKILSSAKAAASPVSSPINEVALTNKNNSPTCNSSKLRSEEEEEEEEQPVAVEENSPALKMRDASSGDDADAVPTVSNDSIQSLIAEMRTICKEQQASFEQIKTEMTNMRNELNAMKCDGEARYKALQENYENIIDVLINSIKPEIFAGNCDSKLQHINQRLLIEGIKNLVTEQSDRVVAALNVLFEKKSKN